MFLLLNKNRKEAQVQSLRMVKNKKSDEPCRVCGSTKTGTTQDGKSKYMIHDTMCYLNLNSTSTG